MKYDYREWYPESERELDREIAEISQLDLSREQLESTFSRILQQLKEGSTTLVTLTPEGLGGRSNLRLSSLESDQELDKRRQPKAPSSASEVRQRRRILAYASIGAGEPIIHCTQGKKLLGVFIRHSKRDAKKALCKAAGIVIDDIMKEDPTATLSREWQAVWPDPLKENLEVLSTAMLDVWSSRHRIIESGHYHNSTDLVAILKSFYFFLLRHPHIHDWRLAPYRRIDEATVSLDEWREGVEDPDGGE